VQLIHPPTHSLVHSPRTPPSSPLVLQGEPVPQATSRAIKELLWGSQGQPPPSWQQGFFFNSHPGLEFGLVQLQGGPCGVLASVQAHVLAGLRNSVSWHFSMTAHFLSLSLSVCGKGEGGGCGGKGRECGVRWALPSDGLWS
jgi:hypothetical protein